MKHLVIEACHTWARSQEHNGIIERFIEEQVFKIHVFEAIGEAGEVLAGFIERNNQE